MRKSLGNLALLGASLVLLAGLLEIGTRLFSRLDPGLTVPDPVVGRRYQRSFEGSVFVPEVDREVALRFNREGFRGADLPYDKPAEVRRVALLGDSFALAIATDEERTAARQLESLLRGWDGGHRWQVMNFGVSGSSTGQELALYREVVRRYRPDLVVCLFAVINDFADNSRRLSSASGVYFDLDASGRLVRLPVDGEAVSGWLNRHSRFYTWQKIALHKLRRGARDRARVVKPGRWIFSTDTSLPDVAHAWTLLERLIVAFARDVERDGGDLVLAVLPAPEQIYDDRWQEVLWTARDAAGAFDRRHPERRLSEIAATAGVPLIDMTDHFRERAPHASLELEDEWLFLNGIGHLNDAGNRLVAEVLFDWVARREAVSGDSGKSAQPELVGG